MAELLIQSLDGQTKTVPLAGERLVVGRSAVAELCFPDDAGLSRQHMVLEREGDDWTVQDLRSRNGTLVNNIPLHVKLKLKPGDRITAGHLMIVYEPWASPDLPSFHAYTPEHHIGDVEKYRKDIGSFCPHDRPFAFGRASVLYEGLDSDGRAICIKLYHKAKSIYLDDFARELTALRNLQHPNILPVLDFGIDTTDTPFIVVPMCKGGDLRSVLRTGRAFLPVREAIPLLAQVASAIDFAHGRGFIHGDIKPENILRSAGFHVFHVHVP